MKKKWFFLGLIPISILLTILAKNNLSFAEYYSLNIYPFFVNSLGGLTSKFRNSISEIIIFVIIFSLLVLTILVIIEIIRHRTFSFLKKYIFVLTSITSVIYFLFVLFCGINYYRYEFTLYSGLEIQNSSKEDLVELVEILIEDANEYRAKLSTNNGSAKLFDSNYYETADRSKNAMNRISEEYNVLGGNFPIPKPVRQSKLMSYLGITGMFFPFTFESNINVHIPPYQIPAVMLHELVHMRGFMREDEANFIAYLASIKSGYDDFYYSGTMSALTHSMNALYMADYSEFERLYKTYTEDVKKDMEFSRSYWRQFETKIQTVSHKINDTYLKANNQHDGVRSYGRMVDLLLAYYR